MAFIGKVLTWILELIIIAFLIWFTMGIIQNCRDEEAFIPDSARYDSYPEYFGAGDTWR